MIYTYGISAPGPYHINNNIPCQDYHHIVRLNEDMVIAAVADGLGSAKHSDAAAEIAATVSVRYCAERLEESTDAAQIADIIRASFVLAQRMIEKKAREQGHNIYDYDTTLTLAFVDRDSLYYGHSGDSGIIALTVEGYYEQVTEQQRDEEARVFPLCFEEHWIFGQYAQKVGSVLLATDGMLEPFFPFYIRNESVHIYVSLARFFMDNEILQTDELGEAEVKEQRKDFIVNIPADQVNDDKTVVVLVNSAIKPNRQPEEYYAEPDWKELKRRYDEEWARLAYPQLFAKTEGTGGEPYPPDENAENKEELSGAES